MQLDDALSATRLQDGRIKVWIHVADPAQYVQPGSIVDMYCWGFHGTCEEIFCSVSFIFKIF